MFLFSKSNILPLKILKTILALCLVVPVLAFSGVIFPYTVPKIFAFRILVEIAAVIYFYLALKYPSSFFFVFPCFSRKEKCHPDPAVAGEGSNIDSSSRNDGTQNDKKKNSHPDPPAGGEGSKDDKPQNRSGVAIGVVALIFFFISFLSAFFGADFYSSFWGNLERGGGVFGLLHFVAFFFMLVSVFGMDNLRKQIPPRATPEASARRASLPLQREEKNKIPPFLKGGEGGFKNQDFIHQLIMVSVFTSALISLLAIFQHFFSLSNLLPQVDRVYSLIGNAGVFGSYLIFNIFLAGYLALSESVILTPPWRGKNLSQTNVFRIHNRSFRSRPRNDKNNYFWIILYSLFIILNSFALLLSGTRGAWLGLLAGMIVFLIILSVESFNHLRLINRFFVSLRSTQNDKKESSHSFVSLRTGSERSEGSERFIKKLPLFFLAAIVILIGSLFFFRNSSFVKNNSTLFRLTSISLSDSTVQSRLILWQNAWQTWQKKPLLGFGPENFETATGPYLSPQLASFEAYTTDRAHNFIFDYGITIGWLGLFGYLLIFFAAGWTLLKSLLGCHSDPAVAGEGSIDSSLAGWRTQNDKQYFSIIFLSLLTAYLVQNLFIFDSFVSYLMLFFILALINNIGQNPSQPPFAKGGEKQNPPLFKGGRGGIYFPLSKKLILLFVIGILSFVIYAFNLKPFLAANHANQILSLPASEAMRANPLLKNALALNSFASPEITYQVVLDYLDKINQNPALAQNEEFYNITATELSKIIERSPSQSKNYVALSWLDLYFSGQEKARIDQSLRLAEKVRELSPNKKDAYLLLVAGYALSGQSQKALETVDQALAIDAKMGEEVKAYFERLK